MAEKKNIKSHDAQNDDTFEDDFFINDSTKGNVEDKTAPQESPKDAEASNGSEEPSSKELEQAMNDAEQVAAQPVRPLEKPKPRWSRKKIALIIVGVVLALVALLAAIPVTRYAIAGLVIKRDVRVTLLDSETDKPVSGVAVKIDTLTSTSDANGVATIKNVPVGSKKIAASKKHYKEASAQVEVPITGVNPSVSVDIEATGRQVPVKVLNRLSQQPLEGAQISADGTSSNTNSQGEAVMVLPADKPTVEATISKDGYNNQTTTITITEQISGNNTFSLTPAGKLYFMSKRNGTLDVMGANLDSTDVKVVLAGTGKEIDQDTTLLASSDWKYLALKAQRDSDRPKLYMIETSSGKLSVIDEGDASFSVVGWSGSHLIYTIHRDKLAEWQPKQESLKTYNATSGVLSIADETAAEGSSQTNYAYEDFRTVNIVKDEIVYFKNWYASQVPMLNGKNATINAVRPDGSNKKVVKSIAVDTNSYFGRAYLYMPDELRFETYQNSQTTHWAYKGGKVAENKALSSYDFTKQTYEVRLVSPSGKNIFWSEKRDGRYSLLVADSNANSTKEVASLTDYVAYGWYTDDYLLAAKDGRELYIISPTHPATITKLADYQKVPNYPGLGYSYGGF